MADGGRKVKVKCPRCKRSVMLIVAKVNRAKKEGYKIFCSRACSSEDKRLHKDDEQKKLEKRLYDMEYRSKNKAMLKVKKADAFQNRSEERRKYEKVYRKKNMQRHVEYCRDPKYKEWKKKYDQEYRAKELGGEFWESYLLILQLDKELDEKMSWYDRQMDKGTLNKANQRKKEYERESSRR